MAKVALAGGHSKKAPGASGYINEYVEDRKVNNALIAEMKRRGHTVKNCSNEASTVNAELASEVNSANKSKAALFCATHFNAFKKTTAKRGVECWYYSGDSTGKKVATAMAKNLSSLLGLPNRGAKATTDLYVIVYTNMTAVLPEVCFCDAKGDTSAYNAKTAAKIASAMADALELGLGKSGGSGSSGSSAGTSKPSGGSSASKPAQAGKKLGKVDVTYELNRYGGGWIGAVKNFNNVNSNGFAGLPYKKHDLFRAKVSKGSIKYRCHDCKSKKWTGWKKDWQSCEVASWIDGIQVYYTTPDGYEHQQAWYRSQTTERAGWLAVCCDDGKSVDGYDGWCGMYGEPLDRIQIAISDSNPFD